MFPLLFLLIYSTYTYHLLSQSVLLWISLASFILTNSYLPFELKWPSLGETRRQYFLLSYIKRPWTHIFVLCIFFWLTWNWRYGNCLYKISVDVLITSSTGPTLKYPETFSEFVAAFDVLSLQCFLLQYHKLNLSLQSIGCNLRTARFFFHHLCRASHLISSNPEVVHKLCRAFDCLANF